MKASIVIANFNNAKFIPECINSIKSQTYKNHEIILFDDNSTDNSIQVAETFENIQIITIFALHCWNFKNGPRPIFFYKH